MLNRFFAGFSPRDLVSGLVVFLVALPLCLGIANASKAAGIPDASNATVFAGVIAGVIGGIVVGLLSGSHTSVSGPAAGLTAVVAVQIAKVGTFEGFLMAVVLAGVLQVGLGLLKAGALAEFFPSGVIKGLLAAIGVLLILKQLPHLVGHDKDPEGDMAFEQPDGRDTFTEIVEAADNLNPAALAIGLTSLALLVAWGRFKTLKRSPVPSALVVVLLGVAMNRLLATLGEYWRLDPEHLVELPTPASASEFLGQLARPDLSALGGRAVYVAALVIAVVASLETLLNLEAVDKLDPRKRETPPNRELLAQGVGNILSGCVGGLPVTAVVVRGSVNIYAGATSKLSAVFHGVLLLVCVVLVPGLLNMIPLSCLAAILIVTGFKLASPKLVKQMWAQGWARFLPFLVTVLAIVLTDLLVGILIGLAVSLAFIVVSNRRRLARLTVEAHVGGEVHRIELANQVSFLNKGDLSRRLHEVPDGADVLLDARDTDYIDPDIVDLIRDYMAGEASARGVRVSLLGFEELAKIDDRLLFASHTSKAVQSQLTPAEVLKVLRDGNARFRAGDRLNREMGRTLSATAEGQYPLAVVLSCIDSRSPAEIVFDLGLGDIFSARVAGNVVSEKMVGSIEYACAVAGSKLIVVMGHTNCGAVTAAVDLHFAGKSAREATGCENLDTLIGDIQKAIPPGDEAPTADRRAEYVNGVAAENVRHTIGSILSRSGTVARLVGEGRVAIIGCLYDVRTGEVEFFDAPPGPGNPQSAIPNPQSAIPHSPR